MRDADDGGKGKKKKSDKCQMWNERAELREIKGCFFLYIIYAFFHLCGQALNSHRHKGEACL